MPAPSLLIFCTVFLDLIGFGIVLPLLPSYAASFHVSEAAIGVLVASFSLMQFLLAHWWGRLSDRIGRRPVLLVGLAGSALSYLLFAASNGFWLLLLSRIIAGGMGATVNVAQAYLADITPADRRPRAMGMIGAAFGLGFVVGPAIGGLSSRLGDAAPGLIAATMTAINFVLTWRYLPESRPDLSGRPPVVPVHWTRFLTAFTAAGGSTLAFTVLYVVFPLTVERDLGYDRRHSAGFFVLIGLVSAIVQGGLIGRLVPRFGERRLMVAGSALLALGLGLIPAGFGAAQHGAGLTLLIGALLALASGSAMVGPSASSFVSRMAPAEEQGRALGLLQSVGSVARIGGPLLAGLVAAHASSHAAFYVASGAAGLAGVAVLFGTPNA